MIKNKLAESIYFSIGKRILFRKKRDNHTVQHTIDNKSLNKFLTTCHKKRYFERTNATTNPELFLSHPQKQSYDAKFNPSKAYFHDQQGENV